jgi:glycosyltransferase involved in cell wall biosynthesis
MLVFMKSFPSCSLIITTYNWPDALEVTLYSAFAQSILPGEIIVCDDGSGAATKEMIDRLKKVSKIPLIHVWQPDEGFQLARIRNKGLAIATGDYIIQIDQDVVLHKHFIKDHLKDSKRGQFLSGNRFNIDERTTKKILAHKKLSVARNPIATGFGFSKNDLKKLRSPVLKKIAGVFYHWGEEYQFILGCNMSFWREDFIRVNGYDENFLGWGFEDKEFGLRLLNSGVKQAFIRFGAIQYHLYHGKAERENTEENNAIAFKTKENKNTWCQLGIDQYLLNSPDKHLTAANS